MTLSENLDLPVCADGRLVPRSIYAREPSIKLKSFDDLQCLTDYIDKLKLCQGCPAEKYPKIASSVVATKEGETARRNTCTVLSFNATCAQCRNLDKLFLQRTKQKKDQEKAQGLLEVDAAYSNLCNLKARKNERRTCFDEEAAECSHRGKN